MQAPQRKITVNFKGRLESFAEPKVMGIINTTPDSFYSQSRSASITAALTKAEKMLQQGATMLDVGGYSSRPGAPDVSLEEEINRVIPTIEQLKKTFSEAIITVDTFRSEVAERAVNAGADAINDISAGDDDDAMFASVARLQVPYFIMHKQGTPQNMQINPVYNDVKIDIMRYFMLKVTALKELGVKDVIIDPSFGFGKSLSHNYELLRSLADFSIFGVPILVGVSRKSMIQKVLNVTTDQALNGTSVLHTLALLNGANVLRVHDVAEAVECIRLVNYYKNKL